MARNIPKALATFVSDDTDTARLSANIQAAVQPLLDFQNKWFSAKPGVLNVLGSIQSLGQAVLTSFRAVPDGTLAAPGLAFLQNGTIGVQRQGTGSTEQLNFRYNGVTFLSITKSGYIWRTFSSTAGLMLFNDSTGALLGTIKNDGTVNMPSYISGVGFKHPIALGHVYVNSTTAGQTQQCVDVIVLVSGSGATARYSTATMPFPGSIVGIVGDCNSTIACAQTIQLYKNGTAMTGMTAQVGANNSFGLATFAKNSSSVSNAFVASDRIYAQITYATAVTSTTTATFVKMYVEMGA